MKASMSGSGGAGSPVTLNAMIELSVGSGAPGTHHLDIGTHVKEGLLSHDDLPPILNDVVGTCEPGQYIPLKQLGTPNVLLTDLTGVASSITGWMAVQEGDANA